MATSSKHFSSINDFISNMPLSTKFKGPIICPPDTRRFDQYMEVQTEREDGWVLKRPGLDQYDCGTRS